MSKGMASTVVLVLMAVAGTALLSGCGAQRSGRSAASGIVVGGIVDTGRVPYGTPGVSRDRFQAGAVEVMRRGQRVAQIRLSAGQRYRFDLPAGRYTLLRDVPRGAGGCPVGVSVAAGHITRVDVDCLYH